MIIFTILCDIAQTTSQVFALYAKLFFTAVKFLSTAFCPETGSKQVSRLGDNSS